MSSSSKDADHSSGLQIIIVRPVQTNVTEARHTLAKEYRRIHRKMLPPFIKSIGGDGIETLAREAGIGLYDPYFPIHAARLAAGKLTLKIYAWANASVSPLDITAMTAFCDIDQHEIFDQPLSEVALGRVAARFTKIDPLEALIHPDDPELLQLWHMQSDESQPPIMH